MYHPERFMTVEVLSEVLSEFEWPAPYTLEDWSPDGILMAFPKSNVFFVEGFEGDMPVKFLPEDTGMGQTLTLEHALLAIGPAPERTGGPLTPNLINDRYGSDLHFIVCDFRGVDTMVMEYLKCSTPYVRVCHVGERPRYLPDKYGTMVSQWGVDRRFPGGRGPGRVGDGSLHTLPGVRFQLERAAEKRYAAEHRTLPGTGEGAARGALSSR
jgi:hypothetical protein